MLDHRGGDSTVRLKFKVNSLQVASRIFQMLCYHNRDMLSASIICAGWDKNKGGQVYCLPLGGMIYFFPSNAFLRRRRKKALLRVNDRGGGWRTCILALCRVCVCTCVYVCVRTCPARLQ